jgi:hypothetical protein
MQGFLAEHPGAFDPAEIRILVAAFDRAWASVQASGGISGAEAESARAVLAKQLLRLLRTASATTAGYATALYWP